MLAMRQFHFVFGERRIVRGILLDFRCPPLGRPEVFYQCWESNFTSGGKNPIFKLPLKSKSLVANLYIEQT